VKRVLRWIALGLLSLLVIALVGGAAFQRIATASAFRKYKPTGRMVDIGDRRLHIVCAGKGPSVVLESGFGGWSVDWSVVQPRIAEFSHVCSYDRAGMGYSDRGPTSATSRAGTASDLHNLLQRADVKPPYILVGHSLGGIYVREFARLYPKDTAGLVLVDSTHEEIAKSVSRKEFNRAMSQLKQLRYARYLMPFGVQRLLGLSISNAPELPPAERSMAKGIGYRSSSYFALYDGMRSLVDENNRGSLKFEPIPDVPLTVIASQKNLDDPEHGEVWRKLQYEFTRMTHDSRYVVAKGSGHFVQVDRPEIVVDAVRDVLKRATISASS
jgi:pimeloyl-ACP methyl ester carboxylesterase